jgi:hypothetical protein
VLSVAGGLHLVRCILQPGCHRLDCLKVSGTVADWDLISGKFTAVVACGTAVSRLFTVVEPLGGCLLSTGSACSVQATGLVALQCQ